MSKEELLQRRAVVTQRFDELTKAKADAEEEMIRLQGEYRLLEDLINIPEDIVSGDDEVKPKRIRKVVEDATN